jgi:hypothetical protein
MEEYQMSPATKRELSETEVQDAIRAVARAIMPDTPTAQDPIGLSLTEAVVGLTAALGEIAEAITDVAAAVREGRAAHSND